MQGFCAEGFEQGGGFGVGAGGLQTHLFQTAFCMAVIVLWHSILPVWRQPKWKARAVRCFPVGL